MFVRGTHEQVNLAWGYSSLTVASHVDDMRGKNARVPVSGSFNFALSHSLRCM